MDVHHVVECGFFEDDDIRNDLRNLVTLCDSCHGKWEGMTDSEQLSILREVIMKQAEDRLSWIREQQKRLKKDT
jgi:predicted HNH restriction endonuclease